VIRNVTRLKQKLETMNTAEHLHRHRGRDVVETLVKHVSAVTLAALAMRFLLSAYIVHEQSQSAQIHVVLIPVPAQIGESNEPDFREGGSPGAANQTGEFVRHLVVSPESNRVTPGE